MTITPRLFLAAIGLLLAVSIGLAAYTVLVQANLSSKITAGDKRVEARISTTESLLVNWSRHQLAGRLVTAKEEASAAVEGISAELSSLFSQLGGRADRLAYQLDHLDFTLSQQVTDTATDITVLSADLEQLETVLEKAQALKYSELTISSGVVTVTSNYHTIDTEGNAATDDLDTISGAAVGQFLILQPASSGRDVTIKNGAGNIYTRDGADVTMTSTSTPLLLLFDNASVWRVVGGQAGL